MMRLFTLLTALAAAPMLTATAAPTITGEYLEVRSCDIYTGPCFANGEMGLTGKEAIMVWSVEEGAWNGITLDGLEVIAVVKTDGTLGDLRYDPRQGEALLIVDNEASPAQRDALQAFALDAAGDLIRKVVAVKDSPIDAKMGTCDKLGCASVSAGDLVDISTRCLGGEDHVCGNETVYYPPLTDVEGAYPAYTTLASFSDDTLNLTWESVETRSTFLARFAR